MRYATLKQYVETGAIMEKSTVASGDSEVKFSDWKSTDEYRKIYNKLSAEISSDIDQFGHHLVQAIGSALPAEHPNGPSPRQKITKNLPWFKHGMKGFLNKLWWGDHPGNPMWQHVESARLSLESVLEIEKYITEQLDELFLMETTSPYPGWTRYDNAIRSAVQTFKTVLIKKIEAHIVDALNAGAKWYKKNVPAPKPPKDKPEPDVKDAPAPTPVPDKKNVDKEEEPEIPDSTTEPEEETDDVPRAVNILTGESKPKIPKKVEGEDMDSATGETPVHHGPLSAVDKGGSAVKVKIGKLHSEWMHKAGLSDADAKGPLTPPHPPGASKDQIEELIHDELNRIQNMVGPNGKIKDSHHEEAIQIMQDCGLDPANPLHTRAVWPNHNHAPLTDDFQESVYVSETQNRIIEMKCRLAMGLC